MRQRPQRGSTLVEAAITLPVLFMLLMAILEFGRAYNIYQVITDAAREGARISLAPFPGTSTLPTTTQVATVVCDFLKSANLPCSTATNLSSPPCSNGKVTKVTVCVDQNLANTVNGAPLVYTDINVRAPYQFLFFPFGTITIGTQAVMRNETN